MAQFKIPVLLLIGAERFDILIRITFLWHHIQGL